MKDSEESSRSVIVSSNNSNHTISNILGYQDGQSSSSLSLLEGQNFQKSQFNHSLHRLYPFVDETKYPLPKCWNPKEKEKSLSLTHCNLRVHYKGQGKSHKDAAAVRANYPIPAACGIYYFEIRIVNKGRDGLFGIGLSQAGVSLNRLPGWDKFSYGYHGDDGHSFSFSGSGIPYGPTFSTGDVIGCGLNLIENYCFYTKNGYNIGVAFTDLPGDLYPTVGLQTPGEIIEANFGQFPFVFDIYEEIKLAQAGIRKTLQTFMLPITKTDCLNKLVSSYLVHHGYSATAESFNKMTDQNAQEDRESISRRERISKLIMNGHIGDAIHLVQKYYPGLLERHKNLLFMMKCRQFVEMVAGNDEFRYHGSFLREQNGTGSKKSTNLPSGYSTQQHSHLQLSQHGVSPMNSGAACACPTKRHAVISPHTSPRESPRNSPHSSKAISNGSSLATPSSPRKYSLPPQAANHNILRHKSASPSINVNAGEALSINNGASNAVIARSSDVSFFSNGCPKCSSDTNGQEKADNGYYTNDSDNYSNIAHQGWPTEQEQNGTTVKDENVCSFDDITPTNDESPIDNKNGFHFKNDCCCSTGNSLLGGDDDSNSLNWSRNAADGDHCYDGCSRHYNSDDDEEHTQNGKNRNDDEDVVMTSEGIDCDKRQNPDIFLDGVEKVDDDMAMDTSDCDEIITNNNAPVTAIDANIALVHFGRELHQLSMQIFSNPSQAETDAAVHNNKQQTPPKNGSSSFSSNQTKNTTNVNNGEMSLNGLAAKRNSSDENNDATPTNNSTLNDSSNYANVKELKMMQDAFSLMAYSDPWKSPVSRQLQAEQREPVAAAVNSLILESHGYPSKPPLEIIIAHAQRLRDEMAKASLGAAACADPMFYMLP